MNVGKPYTQYELMYMAKFYESDGMESLAVLFGRNAKAVCEKYRWMQKRNLLEHYRSLWDEQDVNAPERR
jgi:hypothetical protein